MYITMSDCLLLLAPNMAMNTPSLKCHHNGDSYSLLWTTYSMFIIARTFLPERDKHSQLERLAQEPNPGPMEPTLEGLGLLNTH